MNAVRNSLPVNADLYRRAAAAAQDIIWDYDLQQGMVRVNEDFCRLLGHTQPAYRFHEFIDRVMHPEDTGWLRQWVNESMTNHLERVYMPAHRLRRADGSTLYVEAHAIISYDGDGQPLRMTGVARDITRQHKAELELQRVNEELQQRSAELQASMDRYELVAKATSDIVWDWNLLTDQNWFSGNFEELFGGGNNDHPGMDAWLARLHPDDKERVVNSVRAAIDNGQPHWQGEYRFRRSEGGWAQIFDRGYTIFDADGTPVRMIGSMQDITRLKELQERVASEQIRFQKGITEAAIRSQEREREALGRELHDNINQVLASCKLMTEMSVRETSVRETFLPRTLQQLNLVIEEIRQLSRSLAPPALGEIGLEGSLRELVESADHSCNTNFRLQLSGSVSAISDELALMLYRIVQEAVHNIQKYAGANKATIMLHADHNQAVLSVCDDGSGFNLAEKKSGIGLRNIRSRAGLFGGHCDIEAAPGKGCTIRVLVPLVSDTL